MLLKRVKFRIRFWLGQYPFLFFSVYHLLGKNIDRVVRSDTDLVIEGFPRSGNSFATFAFISSQQRQMQVAHHLHVPAQILRAVKFKIPVLMLIREPSKVVSSLLVPFPWLTVNDALFAYHCFYKPVLPYLDDIVVATFDEVISDFGAVIEKVNKKYNTNFRLFEHTNENISHVFQSIDSRAKLLWRMPDVTLITARPAEEKEQIKRKILNELSETHPLRLRACQHLYESIIMRQMTD